MSVTFLILVFVALLLVGLVVNALFVWLAGKLLRVPTATFRRALALVVVSAIVGVLASWVFSGVTLSQNPLINSLALAGIGLALNLLVIWGFLRTSFWKSLAVGGLWFVAGTVYAVGVIWLVKFGVFETFIVPTGGMAEAILGYHKDVSCPQCGLSFAVNCSQEVDPQGDFPEVVSSCTCPNCRLPIELARKTEMAERDPRSGRRVGQVQLQPLNSYPPQSGDRVLAEKSWFGLGSGPGRFDVIVFDYPPQAEAGRGGIKYVKRVVGLPGETVAVSYGKLYRLAPEKGLRFDDGRVPERQRWQHELMHVDDERAEERWDKGEFEILRKPPAVLLAMRRLVYDNSHPARDLAGVRRWQEGGEARAWAEDGSGHTFRHGAADEARLAWLRYHHVIGRDGRDKPELITDFLGYNSFTTQSLPVALETPHWVGDLMIECEVTIDRPEGELVFELSRAADRFRAAFNVATGDCTLRQVEGHTARETPADEAGKSLATKPTPLNRAGTYRVGFANADDRLLVWVGDDLPFGDGVGYTPSDDHGPTENDLEPAGIGVRGAGVTLGKLQLWRDTYYTPMHPSGRDKYPSVEDWGDPGAWRPLRGLKPQTYYVQPGHYFCLGDNSPHSSDGRVWGLVPERLVRGRVVLTYYPFTRWGLTH